ncbi:MAG: hypothetical protein ACYCST_20195 [Acidimicrobiales bacterium]
MKFFLAATAPGWWTANHVLVLVNVILAAAAVATAIVGVSTIKASNRVAKATELETSQGSSRQSEIIDDGPPTRTPSPHREAVVDQEADGRYRLYGLGGWEG